jgi:hypothetical protein
MREAVGSADLLGVEPDRRIEVVDVAGHLHGEIIRGEASDLSDAVASVDQPRPELLHARAHRGDRSDPGDHDLPAFCVPFRAVLQLDMSSRSHHAAYDTPSFVATRSTA